MDQDANPNIELEVGDPSENLHDMLNEMDTDSEETEKEPEPEQKE